MFVEAKIANGCVPFNSAIAFFASETDAKHTLGSPTFKSAAQDLIGTDKPSCTNLSFVGFVATLDAFTGFQPSLDCVAGVLAATPTRLD